MERKVNKERVKVFIDDAAAIEKQINKWLENPNPGGWHGWDNIEITRTMQNVRSWMNKLVITIFYKPM